MKRSSSLSNAKDCLVIRAAPLLHTEIEFTLIMGKQAKHSRSFGLDIFLLASQSSREVSVPLAADEGLQPRLLLLALRELEIMLCVIRAADLREYRITIRPAFVSVVEAGDALALRNKRGRTLHTSSLWTHTL